MQVKRMRRRRRKKRRYNKQNSVEGIDEHIIHTVYIHIQYRFLLAALYTYCAANKEQFIMHACQKSIEQNFAYNIHECIHCVFDQ